MSNRNQESKNVHVLPYRPTTKTISTILEPVALQVSRFIILHEEGENGREIPDLVKPVEAVSKAARNLIKVGRETINATDTRQSDDTLRRNMPLMMTKVESAASLLQDAALISKNNPHSKELRCKIIQGSKLILHGTCGILTIIDDFEVRKISTECRRVLDYLSIAEVIDSADDLAQFVEDFLPCLSCVNASIRKRSEDLICHIDKQLLETAYEQITTLAPVLISTMNVLIHLNQTDGRGVTEACENRNYIITRMTREVKKVLRVMQFEEDGSLNRNPGNDRNMSANLGAEDTQVQSSSDVLEILQQVVIMLPELSFDVEMQLSNVNDKMKRLGKGQKHEWYALAAQAPESPELLMEIFYRTIVKKYVADFVDVGRAMKDFVKTIEEEEATESVTTELLAHTSKIVTTSKALATITYMGNTEISSAIKNISEETDALCKQLINAGNILKIYSTNEAVIEHFSHMKKRYHLSLYLLRNLCDEVQDSKIFCEESFEQMEKLKPEVTQRNMKGEKSIRNFLEATSSIARLAARIIQVIRVDVENCEDPNVQEKMNSILDNSNKNIYTMIKCAKNVASNWLRKDEFDEYLKSVDVVFTESYSLLDAVNEFPPPIPPYPKELKVLGRSDESDVPTRPPSPSFDALSKEETTTELCEASFDLTRPGPIMLAAKDLHKEMKQRYFTDKNIIAAAKRMALLMAKMSYLVDIERGSRKRLINCAKEIADASEAVSEIAIGIAYDCKDKKMRLSLLQVCESIPTIATQLKIISTVKATMIGTTIREEEDLEATELLVGNAQKLMQAVKETVDAAEAASIKIRTIAEYKINWTRQPSWYQ